MIVSRVNAWLASTALVAVVSLSDVAAQTVLAPPAASPTVQEALPERAAPLAAPQLLAPKRRTGVGEPRTAPQSPSTGVRVLRGATGTGAVGINTLGTVDLESVGVLGDGNGGLGADMWLGTPRHVAAALLNNLPVAAASPTMRSLMRRVLLTQASAPLIAAGAEGEESLIAARVQTLTDMGDLEGVDRLLATVPSATATNPALYRAEAEARFLADDKARACKLAIDSIQVSRDPFWEQALIFCQVLAGEPGKARLGLQVMQETGEPDPVFVTLIEGLLAGEQPDLADQVIASPIHLALTRVADAKVPETLISATRPGVLRAIAVNPKIPVTARLDAAERAEAAGALATERLREIYGRVEFSDEEKDRALSRAAELGGAQGRALLYQGAVTQTIPTAQAEIIGQALDLGRTEGRLGPISRTFLPLVEGLPASAEFDWFAPSAIRVLMSSGRTEEAAPWYSLLQSSALFSDESKVALRDLAPLVALAGGFTSTFVETDPSLSEWVSVTATTADGVDQSALLLGLLTALERPVEETVWQKILPVHADAASARAGSDGGAGTSAPPSDLFLLRFRDLIARLPEPAATVSPAAEATVVDQVLIPVAQSLDDELADVESEDVALTETISVEEPIQSTVPRRAEAVLLALHILGMDGPAVASPARVTEVVAGLKKVDLEQDARALALEAAFARGL